MDIPENVSVQDYFENYVPKLFEEQIGAMAIAGMEGTEFTVQFNVDGQIYAIRVKEGKELEIVKGGIDGPMMDVTLNEDAWRKAITGNLPGSDMFTELGNTANRKTYDAVNGQKGTLTLELTDPDANITVIFNGSATPAVTLKASAATFADINSGKTAAPMAFMQGQLKLEGDMAFAMSLNSLMSG